MLVLSRRLGEKIFIGQDIVLTVVDVDRGKIRLGIEAPRDVPIYRQELLPLAQQQEILARQGALAMTLAQSVHLGDCVLVDGESVEVAANYSDGTVAAAKSKRKAGAI